MASVACRGTSACRARICLGPGNYYATTYAVNPFGHGARHHALVTAARPHRPKPPCARSLRRTRAIAPGDIAPRNALQGLPLHQVDLRFIKDINLPGGVKVTGIAEVFNLFNHRNYGAYNAQINSPTFGHPRQNLLNAYQPRVAQLAFRVGF